MSFRYSAQTMMSGIGITVCLLAAGAVLVSRGDMEVADYIAFNMSATGVVGILMSLSMARRQFLLAVPAFVRLQALQKKKAEQSLDQPTGAESNSLVLMGGPLL